MLCLTKKSSCQTMFVCDHVLRAVILASRVITGQRGELRRSVVGRADVISRETELSKATSED